LGLKKAPVYGALWRDCFAYTRNDREAVTETPRGLVTTVWVRWINTNFI